MKLSTLITVIVLFSINFSYGSDMAENKSPAHWAKPISMNELRTFIKFQKPYTAVHNHQRKVWKT